MNSPIASSGFRALVTREVSQGLFRSSVEERTSDDLPAGDVTIDVHFSSINYKDMLVVSGHRGITRSYPHTPGIDAAGVVLSSTDPAVPVGAEVVVIGYDLGMNTSGGFSERIRVPAAWVLTKPPGLSLREVMGHGTAGLTAALCVSALEAAGVLSAGAEVLVTGATGGVGAIAVAMLATRGVRVVASTRRASATAWLETLGASEVIPPDALAVSGTRPMGKERWAGAVDSLGGEVLFEIVKSLRYGGTVAACGMAAGGNFAGNVYPFILRGVRLLGVDSVELPLAKKQAALDSLAGSLRIDSLDRIASEITLDEVVPSMERARAGEVLGRHRVRLRD